MDDADEDLTRLASEVRELISESHDAEHALLSIVTAAGSFDSAVARAREAFPTWRRGQTHCNVLRLWRPDLYRELVGTEVDPFYRDDRLPAFRTWLADRLWDA